MKLPKGVDAPDIQRATRWDLIKKRHNHNNALIKSEAVKRLIELDFIGTVERQRLLQYEKNQLNPSVVMNIRHEMCKQMPKALPLATVQQKMNDSWCKQHNLLVEERQISNELSKLRDQLNRQRKRNSFELKSTTFACSEINNECLLESLRKSAKHIEDCYQTPLDAMEDMQLIFDTAKHARTKKVCEAKSISIKPPEIQDVAVEEDNVCEEIYEIIDEIDRSEKMAYLKVPTTAKDITLNENLLVEQECHEQHCVRFEATLKTHKHRFQRENSYSSNTSDGIDSVISDLAEEALQELREEEAIKQQEQQLDTNEPQQKDKDVENVEKKEVVEKLQIDNKSKEFNQATAPLELIVRRLEVPNKKPSNINKQFVLHLSSSEEEESVSNDEQNKIIEQLFQSRAHTNLVILRKYFMKWIHFTTMEKIERENMSCKTSRIQQINVFLDKLRKEKTRINKCPIPTEPLTSNNSLEPQKSAPQITKKYQNKIKMQQDIIDLQRLKLERQERIIMELKLHKISEEAKEAREELKQELKSVIKCGDAKAKAKAKCLQLIGNLRDQQDMQEDELARLQGKAFFMPKFLQTMQERALERSIKHEQARKRRLQQEAEREALKIAIEEARRLEDEDAKQRRIEVLREKRRQEKLSKILREQRRQRAIESHRKSLEFCRIYLLRRVGMEAFKRLLERKRQNQRKSETLRRFICKRNCFKAWQKYCAQLQAQKLMRATLLHEKFLKRRTFAAWTFYVGYLRSNFLVAVDWYNLQLTENVFREWFYLTKRNQLNETTKMRQAISHHEWHTKWKVLDCWQRLSHILQIERETEERRQRWRLKIWELLPDYEPNCEDT